MTSRHGEPVVRRAKLQIRVTQETYDAWQRAFHLEESLGNVHVEEEFVQLLLAPRRAAAERLVARALSG
ncbi:MAG: hypothetical protein ACREB9_01215 [Thermoplasmata archaeon]